MRARYPSTEGFIEREGVKVAYEVFGAGQLTPRLRDFASRFRPARPEPRAWARPLNRPARVLYMSSPIGLGHACRDLAMVDELRKLRPGLEVHWLAQHPVTELLKRRSEHIHPASAFLASESGHIESAAAEHDLHAFQAIRDGAPRSWPAVRRTGRDRCSHGWQRTRTARLPPLPPSAPPPRGLGQR